MSPDFHESEDLPLAAALAFLLTWLSSAAAVLIGGIEGGPNVVHFILCPGMFVAWAAMEFISQFVSPTSSWVAYMAIILYLSLTFGWYGTVSFVVLKIWRAIDGYLKKRQ